MVGAKGTAGTTLRRLLALLVVTTGATLAWVKARRRQLPGSMPRSWSELDSAAPATLVPAPAPAAARPAATPAEAPDVEAPAGDAPAVEESAGEAPAVEPPAVEPPAVTDETASVGGPVPGPYPGSVLPLDDGSAPSEEFVVKGNAGSKRSHSPDSPYFGRTRAEVWFRSQEDAKAAGFAPWTPRK
ncbi:MAG TPA: hypothetical protein VL595_11355 [Pseudonocardia sp.]|nr:hypothetical protein [Pseudonocardia sp.]